MGSFSPDLNQEMQRMIQRELELNGVNLKKREWLSSSAALREFSFMLMPEVHEGKIHSYGVLFVEDLDDLDAIEMLPVRTELFETARKLADGIEWFILYERDQFRGLARFKFPLLTELEMVRHFPIAGGMLVQRDADGISRFFQGEQLSVHANRRWYTKPGVKQAVWKVSQCVPNVDKDVLGRLLEFSFHLVSPMSRVGAILVWFLDEIPPVFQEYGAIGPDLSGVDVSLMEENHTKMISHFLSQLDGAIFMDRHGRLIKAGVHLKFSEKSMKLVPEYRGTRHTSSVRFSFDHPDTIVVTISEDGPVTVFSDGASIADLQIYSAHKKARLLRTALPNRSERISSTSFELRCENCGKNSMIEKVQVDGFEEVKKVQCPTCKVPLYSAECFSIECRPYKTLLKDEIESELRFRPDLPHRMNGLDPGGS